MCHMGQHGCSPPTTVTCYNCAIWGNMGAHSPAVSLVTPSRECMMWQDPSTGYHIVDPLVRASHSTVCHHYSMALLRGCMMRQDPSGQWLPEVLHWVQPSSWASHSTIYHQYSSIHTHQVLVAGSYRLTYNFQPCLTQVGPSA